MSSTHLRTTFLLAAAAAASQLDATDYLATWTLSNSNTVKLTIGVDPTLFQTSGTNFWSNGSPTPWFTKADLVITNPSNSIVASYTKATVTLFSWYTNGVDFSVPHTNLAFYSIYINGGQYNLYPIMGGFSSAYGTKNGYRFIFDSFGPAFSGVIDVASWMSSVNNQTRIYNAGVTLASLPLEGAHHRPMLSFDRMGKESQAWATGDFGSSSRTRDVHVTTGEGGVNWNLGKSFLFGVAAGHGEQNADLAFGGASSTKGDYALAELDYRPEGTQWIVSLLGMVGSWEAKVNRGYQNGASLDSSFGTADLITRTARLRVDAPSLVSFGGFGFAPYASYSVTQTAVDAYSETGGAFPATFDSQEHNATEARLGITAAKDLSAATKLLLTVEAIHRFDGAGPALTGQDVTGGVSFSLPGTAPRADSVRFGFDVDHKLSENTLLNLSAHVATLGEEHDVSAAISIRRAF